MLILTTNDKSFKPSYINQVQSVCEKFITKEPWHTLSETVEYLKIALNQKYGINHKRLKIVHEPKRLVIYDKNAVEPAIVIENKFFEAA